LKKKPDRHRIIQWFIGELDGRIVPNLFPWNRVLDDHSNLREVFNEWNNAESQSLSRLTGWATEEPIISWSRYTEETEFRIIGRDSDKFDHREMNVFPIRFRNHEDQLFRDPGEWPVRHLPEYVLDFLRQHHHIRIMYHEPHEAKQIEQQEFATLPALQIMHQWKGLNNKTLYVNSAGQQQDRLKKIAWNPHYNKANRLVSILNSDQWLQMNYNGNNREWLRRRNAYRDEHNLKQAEDWYRRKPDFDSGRFLFLGGRPRITRYWALSQYMKVLPESQLFASLHGVNRSIDPKTGKLQNETATIALMNSLFTAMKNKVKRYSLSEDYLFTEEQQAEMTEFAQRCPINTFSEDTREPPKEYYMRQFYNLWPNPRYYRHIFVDLCPETFSERPFENTVFVTEKIQKPMYACRPFVPFANPGFLKYLRQIGFRTFSDWWDESYDEAENRMEQMDKLLATIETINSWSREKCTEVYAEMQETLLHNHNHLLWYANNAPRTWIESVREHFIQDRDPDQCIKPTEQDLQQLL